MAVVIRMKRTGRKNRPCYRISVADSRKPCDGRTLENLGLYDPVCPVEDAQIRLDVDRAKHWVQHGAKPSETVASIFRRFGVYEGMPEPGKRTRPGRAKDTASKASRKARKDRFASAKAARRDERTKAKYAARKAAKEAAAAEGGA